MQLTALPLSALILLNAADAPAQPPLPAVPEAVIIELQPFEPPAAACQDNATPTKNEPARQPRFEREPAMPDSGQIIYAVDRRIDGCSVILVKGAARTVRPLPEQSDDPLQAVLPESGK